jgi:hypothetical protein
MADKLLGTEWLVEQLRNGKELNDELISQAKGIEESKFIERKVLIKDYEKDVNYLMLALKGVGIYIDYPTADLVCECTKMIKQKGDKSSLMDMCEIKHQHSKKWNEYFKKLNTETKETE